MNANGGIALLLVIAFGAANLPFFSERILFIKAPPIPGKALGWRLLELILLYFLVGALSIFLESRIGVVYPQTWEFYPVTFFLFVVFAYPGFVFRYLWRKRA